MSNQRQISEELQMAWKRISMHWQESEKAWNDSVRQDFDKRYWQPLAQETQSTAREMERLNQILAQVRRNVQ